MHLGEKKMRQCIVYYSTFPSNFINFINFPIRMNCLEKLAIEYETTNKKFQNLSI